MIFVRATFELVRRERRQKTEAVRMLDDEAIASRLYICLLIMVIDAKMNVFTIVAKALSKYR